MTLPIPRSLGTWLVAMLLALLLGAGLVAWRFDRDDALLRVQQVGVLRVGCSIEPPFAWVQTALDRQIPDLLAGRFDVIGAGLFISPERATQVRFSIPTLRVRPAYLTRAAAPAPTLQALRDGLNLAVVRGSAAERRLSAQRCLDAGMDDHLSKPVEPEVPDQTMLRWYRVREHARP